MKYIVIGAAVLFLTLILLRFKGGEKTQSPVGVSVTTTSSNPVTGGPPTGKPNTGPRLISPPPSSLPPPNLESLRALRDNPEIKKKLEENFRKSIEESHGEFIATLSPELQEKVRTLLLNHRLGLGDLLVPGSPPPPVEKLMERDKAHEEELKQTLGEKAYGELSEYKKTIPSRRDVSKLEEKAASLGVPLTPEQKSSVLEIITAERTSALSKYSPENIKNGVPLAGTSNEGSPTGGTPDPAAMIKAFEADQAAADQAALSKAEGILSDAQADLLLEVLREKMERRPPPMASPAPALPQN